MKSAAWPLIISAACLFAVTGCGSQLQNTLKVQNDLSEAQQAAQIGDTAKARVWADQAVQVDPQALSTYVSTGDPAQGELTITNVFSDAGDLKTLRDYLKQAIIKFPKAYQPLAKLSHVDELLGDKTDQLATATALAALLETKITQPGTAHDMDLTRALAQSYCDAGNLAKCAADYQAVIKAAPSDSEAYNNLAYAYAVADSKPDLPQARQLAVQAITLATHANMSEEGIGYDQDTLGWVQYRQQDYHDALDNIQSAVNVAPRQPEARYHLGMVYLALHQPAAAAAELDHAAQLAQGYADAQAALAQLKKPTPELKKPTPDGATTAQR